jgi:formate dehydrogenase subunit beta
MNTMWTLKTGGDALARVRIFLAALWQSAGLEGMLVPVLAEGERAPHVELLTDAGRLAEADPFAPLMLANGARDLADRAQAGFEGRLGAVLRPCEIRALTEVVRRRSGVLGSFLLVGVDCLATFAPQDYERRARELGGPDELTREALLFSRQGGILLYRNRPACQRCGAPLPATVDLCLGVHGLTAGEAVLVTARDDATSDKYGLERITDGPAPREMIAQHERMAATLAARRGRVRSRMEAELGSLPASVDELIAHLRACAPCRACLEACPIYDGELEAADAKDVAAWLSSCAGCGMCEQACPNHLALPAVIDRIRRGLSVQSGLSSSAGAEMLFRWF